MPVHLSHVFEAGPFRLLRRPIPGFELCLHFRVLFRGRFDRSTAYDTQIPALSSFRYSSSIYVQTLQPSIFAKSEECNPWMRSSRKRRSNIFSPTGDRRFSRRAATRSSSAPVKFSRMESFRFGAIWRIIACFAGESATAVDCNRGVLALRGSPFSQRMRRSPSAMGASLMLARRRRIRPSSSNSQSSLP